MPSALEQPVGRPAEREQHERDVIAGPHAHPQKSRVMIDGRPPPPPHFSGTSVGSPVVPEVDITAGQLVGRRAHSSPPYGSPRSSRKRRTASLSTNGARSRKSASVRDVARVHARVVPRLADQRRVLVRVRQHLEQQLLLQRFELRARHRLVLGVVVLGVDRRQVHRYGRIPSAGRQNRSTWARAVVRDRSRSPRSFASTSSHVIA